MNPVCWLVRRRLGALEDGELGVRGRARVAAHLGRCSACAAERAELAAVRELLRMETPEPPEAVWDAFWPQVRARMASAPLAEPEPLRRRPWQGLAGSPRLAVGSALVAGALAVLAVLAPWEPVVMPPGPPASQSSSLASRSVGLEAPFPGVVVQSVEAVDPQSSVMVFTKPESDMTVVWVFGLPRT